MTTLHDPESRRTHVSKWIPDTLMICYCDAGDVLGIYTLTWKLRKMTAGCLPKTRFRALTNRYPDASIVLATRHRAHVEWVRALRRISCTSIFLHIDASDVPDGEIHALQSAERVMREKINILSRGKIPVDHKYRKPEPLPVMTWEEEWMEWIDWEKLA